MLSSVPQLRRTAWRRRGAVAIRRGRGTLHRTRWWHGVEGHCRAASFCETGKWGRGFLYSMHRRLCRLAVPCPAFSEAGKHLWLTHCDGVARAANLMSAKQELVLLTQRVWSARMAARSNRGEKDPCQRIPGSRVASGEAWVRTAP